MGSGWGKSRRIKYSILFRSKFCKTRYGRSGTQHKHIMIKTWKHKSDLIKQANNWVQGKQKKTLGKKAIMKLQPESFVN